MAKQKDLVNSSVAEFLGCWAVTGKANLTLDTVNGVTTVSFATTLPGHPEFPLHPASAPAPSPAGAPAPSPAPFPPPCRHNTVDLPIRSGIAKELPATRLPWP